MGSVLLHTVTQIEKKINLIQIISYNPLHFASYDFSEIGYIIKNKILEQKMYLKNIICCNEEMTPEAEKELILLEIMLILINYNRLIILNDLTCNLPRTVEFHYTIFSGLLRKKRTLE